MPGNLPSEVNSFVGRQEDVAEVARLLSRSRVVTLTGVGGVGKTRLATRSASLLRPAPRDGAWLVELAAVTDPAFVAEVIAGALRVPEQTGREAAEALERFLADRELLLVLDNSEHLLAECAPLVTRLLARAEGLRVLATSREPLGVAGEVVYRVAPLPLVNGAGVHPSAASSAATDSAAVTLFAHRAAAAAHGFEVTADNAAAVAEICGRLDGLPLAIELAAAHVRYLRPQQIADRLEDRFALLGRRGAAGPLGRTLRDAVDWSHELCSTAERKLWSRLSVFAVDFDLEDAEAVCTDATLDSDELFDALLGLVEKSLLVRDEAAEPARYRMLDTIREYGLGLLHSGDPIGVDPPPSEEELRLRHLHWYAELASEFERAWFGPDQPRWRARIAAELPNIRAALQFAQDRPAQVATGQMLAADLRYFWLCGVVREGSGWLTSLVDAGPESTRERVHAQAALTWVAVALGALDVALRHDGEALAVAPELAPELVSRLSTHRAFLLMSTGDPSAVAAMDEALVLALGSVENRPADAALAAFGAAFGRGVLGDFQRSAELWAQSASIARNAGDIWWLSAVRAVAGFIAFLGGDVPVAEESALEGIALARRLPDVGICASGLTVLALREVGRDDLRAAYLLGMTDRYWQDAGGSMFEAGPWAPALPRARESCREGLGSTTYDAEHARGWGDPIESGVRLVLGEGPETVEVRPAGEGLTLTRREEEVAGLVAQGLSTRQIATQLFLSPRTVESHVQHILQKGGFRSRSQIAVWQTHRASG